MADEQKQRLKIAFAEGYLTATHPDHERRSGKAMRYLKVLQQLLIIVVFIGIFISLFVSTNGSVFRSDINPCSASAQETHVAFPFSVEYKSATRSRSIRRTSP